ncbi:MAG: transposase [Roseiflexaceae bacterium]
MRFLVPCSWHQRRHPTSTIEHLVRAEFVRAWALSCSDPELEWLLASNLLARAFVGLPLLGPTPDHSTLSRFHAWMTIHAPDALFRDVIAFLDRLDPEDTLGTPQIVDTFAMAAPVAACSAPAALLRQLTLRLIHTWWADAPAPLQLAIPPLDLGALVRVSRWRTAAEQQALLQQAVSVATWVAAGVTPHLAACDTVLLPTATALVQAIRKVIADETSTDAAGLVQELSAAKKGSYRIMSALDLEATFRKHEGSPAVIGTNAVISTTSTRIRAAVALTGSTPDSEAPCAVLCQEQAAGDRLPAVLLMDQAAGHGKTRAQVDTLSQGLTTLVSLIPQAGGADLSRFTPVDFRISDDGGACTCPNGVTSTHWYPHGDSEGVFFRFLASQCRGCPL